MVGIEVRHPLFISDRSKPKHNKTKDTPIDLLGFDIETDHVTGKPMLLGDSEGKLYLHPRTVDRPKAILNLLRSASSLGKALCHWREFDSIGIYRILCEALPENDRMGALRAYDKEGYSFPVGDWVVVAKRFGKGGCYEFGIPGEGRGFKVPCYDISAFYFGGLEKVCGENGIAYSKMDREFHLIDWERYRSVPEYFGNVNSSNEMDAKAAEALGNLVSEAFCSAFGSYPKSMYSAGGLCKAALSTVISRSQYEGLNYYTCMEEWVSNGTSKTLCRELWCMAHESYSGGLIDCYQLGSTPEAHIADIASAYPAVIRMIPNLQNSRIVEGEHSEGLTLLRGKITIPSGLFHSVSFRSVGDTKSRCAGTMVVTIWREERDWILANGGSFVPEKAISVIPGTGTNPLAEAVNRLIALRKTLKGTAGERIAKDAVNSLYGVSYELSPEYDSVGNYVGFVAGELYNPLVASYITAITRIRLAMGMQSIGEKGGKVIAAMTDSISWIGESSDLPTNYSIGPHECGVREVKTVGYFEKPETVTNYLSLGAGRYEYTKGTKLVTRARGYRTHDAGSLRSFVESAVTEIVVPTRVLISPGLCYSRPNRLKFEDLGRVMEDRKRLDPFQLTGKRHIKPIPIALLLSEMVSTDQIWRDGSDNTLPEYRERFMEQQAIADKVKRDLQKARWTKDDLKRYHPEWFKK